MVNQSIALQVRSPSSSGGGNSFAQNMQIMNMMAQRTAAERQAQQAQQTMGIQAAQEGRAAALSVPTQQLAEANATKGDLDTLMSFNQHVAVGLQAADTPDQVIKYANIIGSQPQFQGINFQNTLQQAVSSMPTDDPAKFANWKTKQLQQTLNGEKQLQQHFVTRDLGTTSDVFASPEFGGGPGQVVPGSTATKTPQLTGMNVEGVGAGGYDPATNTFSPAAMGATGAVPSRGAGVGAGAAPTPAAGGASALATNPGALKDGPFARAQPGYAGASGGFATFNTPAQGVNAQESLLAGSYINKGINTIDKIVNRYAPPGAENSPASVANYKQYIAQQTGIDPTSPISAAQVPAVAKAMREFETGQRAGGGAAPAPAAAAQETTTQAGARATKVAAAKSFFQTAGVNPNSQKDPVADLIRASTSGGGETLGANAMGWLPEKFGGGTTSGQKAIGALGVIGSKLTVDLLGGKLGAGISDADRSAIEKMAGIISDSNVTADKRLAAWRKVKEIQASYLGMGAPSNTLENAGTATGGKQRRPLTDFGKAR